MGRLSGCTAILDELHIAANGCTYPETVSEIYTGEQAAKIVRRHWLNILQEKQFWLKMYAADWRREVMPLWRSGLA